jgi:uncharacterized membrane protein
VYQVPVLDWVAVSVWMQNLSLAQVGEMQVKTNQTHSDPETRFEKWRGIVIALILTALSLPIIGLWAAANGIEKIMRKLCPRT